MLMQQQQKQYFHENSYSPTMSRIPTTISPSSSWHPIQSSPSEDMWELPASSSSMSDDRDDFPTSSGLHQEFTIYQDDYPTAHNRNGINNTTIQDEQTPMAPTVTVRTTRSHDDHRRYSVATMSNTSTRSSMGLSGKKCVLGDATNTVRTQNYNSRRVQRSYFNWFDWLVSSSLSKCYSWSPVPSILTRATVQRLMCAYTYSIRPEKTFQPRTQKNQYN